MAMQELDEMAQDSANQAIKLDQQGARGLAVTKYQRTVEVLLKICDLYPDSPRRAIYAQYATAYQNRIKALQSQITTGEPVEKGRSNFDELVLKEKPNVRWEDIANLKEAKKALEESILYPVRRPDLFPLGWPRGILLFGPPGCGKTMLAAAAATEIDAVFYCMDAASMMSKWLGESEQNIAKLFENARRAAEGDPKTGRCSPSIVFVDEIDSLIGERSEEVGGEVRARNQLLKEMDSIIDKNKKLHVYVIGATNKPWAFDEPFIRRFQKRILVPVPDEHARNEMIKLSLKNLRLDPSIDMEYLCKMTSGYSASDIHDACQSAQIGVVRELFESNGSEDKGAQPRPISMGDFERVLQERRPSVTPEMMARYGAWNERFKAL